MTGIIREKIIAAKTGVVRDMLAAIATLPLASPDEFTSDRRMVAAGESFVRRALEALLDLGRHILAKGFAAPVAEYREIGKYLADRGVLAPEVATLLQEMGGYRNRLTHFYDEVTPGELFDILTSRVGDLETVLDALLAWVRRHPERLDSTL